MRTQIIKRAEIKMGQKIKLNYENRNFFHPSPSSRMITIINTILSNLDWQIEIPVDKLTRQEAKELIDKGIKTAKRKGIYLLRKELTTF